MGDSCSSIWSVYNLTVDQLSGSDKLGGFDFHSIQITRFEGHQESFSLRWTGKLLNVDIKSFTCSPHQVQEALLASDPVFYFYGAFI